MRRPPGEVRNEIIRFLESVGGEATTKEINLGISKNLGKVAKSSTRSYLRLNTPIVFERTGRGRYKLNNK